MWCVWVVVDLFIVGNVVVSECVGIVFELVWCGFW